MEHLPTELVLTIFHLTLARSGPRALLNLARTNQRLWTIYEAEEEGTFLPLIIQHVCTPAEFQAARIFTVLAPLFPPYICSTELYALRHALAIIRRIPSPEKPDPVQRTRQSLYTLRLLERVVEVLDLGDNHEFEQTSEVQVLVAELVIKRFNFHKRAQISELVYGTLSDLLPENIVTPFSGARIELRKAFLARAKEVSTFELKAEYWDMAELERGTPRWSKVWERTLWRIWEGATLEELVGFIEGGWEDDTIEVFERHLEVARREEEDMEERLSASSSNGVCEVVGGKGRLVGCAKLAAGKVRGGVKAAVRKLGKE